MMNRDQLLETLEKYEVPTHQWDTDGGGTLVVVRRGARILGLFPSAQGTSACALWINPNIQAVLSGKSVDWQGPGAGGIGGERLWFAPERNFFYKDPATFGEWTCQLDMDPGAYAQIAEAERSVQYENVFDLRDGLRGLVYKKASMRRRIALLEHPCLDVPAFDDLAYAGLEVADEISIPQADEDPRVCPWSLSQVTPSRNGQPGTVLVPTARRAEPVGYFGDIPPERLRVADDHVAFRIDAREIHKLGVRAEDLPAQGPVRIGYLKHAFQASTGEEASSADSQWLLVVKESDDIARSSDMAVDPARENPEGPRGVIQSYNGGPTEPGEKDYPAFGEIEMQFAPARQNSQGAWQARATHRLLAFQGEREAVVAAAGKILGIEKIEPFEL